LCRALGFFYIWNHFGNGRDWGVQIAYAIETELLGTAGAIRSAQSFIEDTFLVLNGDSYLEADLLGLIESHRHQQSEESQIIETIAIVAVDDATSYGNVELNGEARFLGFEEKVESGPGWINGGICVLEPTILDFIPSSTVVSVEKEIFPLILEQNLHLFGYPVQGFFVDIGTPKGYYRFCRHLEKQAR
jgi:mannose-1-phosphate guanylyltransferase